MPTSKTVWTDKVRHSHVNLKAFCTFANDADFLTVTEWANGEGFDVEVQSINGGERHFRFTWGEYDALKAIMDNWGYTDVIDQINEESKNEQSI